MTVPILAAAFLAPTFAVVGLCLAALPILIHLLNRRRYKVVDWAAMSFLMRAMRRNRRRVRFEQLLLLACRCLLLALLGTALARPLGCGSNSAAAFGGRTGLHVFVIDNGYTMSGPSSKAGLKTHLDQAKRLADGIIDQLASGGESVVVITAGRPAAAPIPKPTYDLQQARGIVDRVPQTYAAVDLSDALRMAVEVGREDDRQPNKNLYVLTDEAAAAWQGADAPGLKAVGPELAKLFRVVHFNLSTPGQWDQAVLSVTPTSDLVTTNPAFAADFSAAVKGFGPTRPATVQWKVDGRLMPGGGPLTPTPTTPVQTESRDNIQGAILGGGPHVVSATVVGDDPLAADNTAYRVVNVVAGLKTLIVEGQHTAEGGSGTNLQIALSGLSTSGKPDGFAAPDLISDLELGNRILSDYRAVVLCGVGQLSEAQADQVKAFVDAGGTLMVFLGPDISADNYDKVLLPRHLIPGPLTKVVTAGVNDPGFYFDFNPNAVLHPLLRAFAGQPKSGLENVHRRSATGSADVPDGPHLRVLNWQGSAVNGGGNGGGGNGGGGHGGKPDPAVTEPRPSAAAGSCSSRRPRPSRGSRSTRKPVYTELVNELLGGSVNAGDGWMNLSAGEAGWTVPAAVKLTGDADADSTRPAGPSRWRPPAPTAGSAAFRSPPAGRGRACTRLSTGGEPGDLPVAVNVPAGAADVRTPSTTPPSARPWAGRT